MPSSLEAQRLADVIVERLRLHAQAVVVRSVRTELLRVAADAIAIADRDVEHPVLAEVDAAGNVAARLPRVGDEDLFDVTERVAFEMPARDGERRSLRALLRIRDVYELVAARTSDAPRRSAASRFPPLSRQASAMSTPASVRARRYGSFEASPFFSVTRIVFASANAMPHG